MYREKEGNLEKNKDFANSDEFLKLKKIIESIKKKYALTDFEIFNRLKEKEILIPVSIFNKKLGCLETITKYLKENLDLRNKDIAKLIGRSDKTVSQAYQASRKKLSEKFEIEECEYYIPIKILAERKLSVLESIAKFLADNYDLSLSKIAKLLHRDPRTIWTVYSRARKKDAK